MPAPAAPGVAALGLRQPETVTKTPCGSRRAPSTDTVGKVRAYGTPSTAGRLNPMAIQARSSFRMNFQEWRG